MFRHDHGMIIAWQPCSSNPGLYGSFASFGGFVSYLKSTVLSHSEALVLSCSLFELAKKLRACTQIEVSELDLYMEVVFLVSENRNFSENFFSLKVQYHIFGRVMAF